jgi:hypothetical protein
MQVKALPEQVTEEHERANKGMKKVKMGSGVRALTLNLGPSFKVSRNVHSSPAPFIQSSSGPFVVQAGGSSINNGNEFEKSS